MQIHLEVQNQGVHFLVDFVTSIYDDERIEGKAKVSDPSFLFAKAAYSAPAGQSSKGPMASGLALGGAVLVAAVALAVLWRQHNSNQQSFFDVVNGTTLSSNSSICCNSSSSAAVGQEIIIDRKRSHFDIPL